MSKDLPRIPVEIYNIILDDPELMNKLTLLSRYHHEMSIDVHPEILLKLNESLIANMFGNEYQNRKERLLEGLKERFLRYVDEGYHQV